MPGRRGSITVIAVIVGGLPAYAAQTTPEAAALVTADAASETCMAQAIYYEAGREPDAGQQAVARVVLNRLADAAYPKTVCGVVFQGSHRRTGCQFTFTCDGSLRRAPAAALWARASAAAHSALTAPDALPAMAAVNYHADYVRPYWSGSLARETQIGRHIFYAREHEVRTVSARTSSQAPQAAIFSAWGLPIARIAPAAGGAVSVAPAMPEGTS